MNYVFLQKKLSDFLNCIPDENFEQIMDSLLLKTKKKTKESFSKMDKITKINNLVKKMDFTLKDRNYNNLVGALKVLYLDQNSTYDNMNMSIDEAISKITINGFIENTSYIIYKYCRPPYIANLSKLFESPNFKKCLGANNNDAIIMEKNDTKESVMKYYIGYIEKRGTFFNFKPEFIFDGSKILKNNGFTEEFPTYGKFNMAYKRYKESQNFLDKVDLNDLYAVNADLLNFKENRNNLDNTLIDEVQKQIDLQDMCDNNVDLSKVIFSTKKLNIYKVATPIVAEIDNSSFIEGIIEISNNNYNNGDNVLLLFRDKLYGPYQMQENPRLGVRYVRPNLNTGTHKYIRKYLDNVGNENVFSLYVDYYNEDKIDFAYFDEKKVQVEDIIPDDILLAELNKIYSINIDSKTTFDRLTKDSEFLSSELSDEMRDKRKDRVLAQFKTFDELTESKKSIIRTLINSDWNSIEGMTGLLEGKLREFQEYVDLKDEYERVLQENKELCKEKDSYEKQIQELNNKDTQEKLEQKEKKDIKKENDDLYRANEQLKAENCELQKKMEKVREQVEDWRNIRDLKKKIDDLDKEIDIQNRTKYKLEDTIEEAKSRLKNSIKESINETKIAFDPVLSSIMLDEASKLQSEQTKEEYSIYCDKMKAAAEKIESKSEDVLLDYLVGSIQKYRNYNFNSIINMYICISQSFLTIFAGNPGTGKTSICNIIANSLGLNNPIISDKDHCYFERFVPVSVERGWSSKRDLIGYYNPLTKKYDKNNVKVYDALRILDIEKNNSKFPMIILLDEANLSPIEYYWAEFMRVADRDSDTAKINIGEENDLYIPETLRFVATINYDQTTEELSPRLIDRAWIIKLPEIDMDYDQKPNMDNVFKDNILWSDIKKVFFPRDDDSVELVGILDQIYEEFATVGLPVSYRVKDSIYNYVKVAQRLMQDESAANAKYQAIDYAVLQKLLPKINGNNYNIFLEKLKKICDDSHLIKTKEAIDTMFEQAENNLGYYQYL